MVQKKLISCPTFPKKPSHQQRLVPEYCSPTIVASAANRFDIDRYEITRTDIRPYICGNSNHVVITNRDADAEKIEDRNIDKEFPRLRSIVFDTSYWISELFAGRTVEASAGRTVEESAERTVGKSAERTVGKSAERNSKLLAVQDNSVPMRGDILDRRVWGLQTLQTRANLYSLKYHSMHFDVRRKRRKRRKCRNCTAWFLKV